MLASMEREKIDQLAEKIEAALIAADAAFRVHSPANGWGSTYFEITEPEAFAEADRDWTALDFDDIMRVRVADHLRTVGNRLKHPKPDYDLRTHDDQATIDKAIAEIVDWASPLAVA